MVNFNNFESLFHRYYVLLLELDFCSPHDSVSLHLFTSSSFLPALSFYLTPLLSSCSRSREETFLYLAGNNHLIEAERLIDLDALVLYKTLKNNMYVVGLDLRYNRISDEGAKYLADLIEVGGCSYSTLQKIYQRNINIIEAGSFDDKVCGSLSISSRFSVILKRILKKWFTGINIIPSFIIDECYGNSTSMDALCERRECVVR